MKRPLKLLVIDDSDDDRELCRRVLRLAFGDRLILVEETSGDRGLAAIEKTAQDCILLDYSLPGRNGIEVLKRIQSRHPHLPVIMLTGAGSEGIAAQSIKEGAEDYITKADITPGVLSHTISAAMKNSAQRRRFDEQNATLAETNASLDRLSKELATARDRAELADRAKSRFLAAMTHELRTPLHAILGYAELLTLEGGLDAGQSRRLEAMTACGEHLLDSVNAVLDISQIDADRLQLYPARVDLAALAQAGLDVVRPVAEAKGLLLVMAPAAPIHIVADPTRLRQVIINLLGNAVKFTPSGSVEVRVEQTAAGSDVRLEVADTGPGIWPRHRDKLFKDFERINARTVTAVEGTGLGLAISARLVKLMGGQIGYLDNPSGGSVFWLEMPVGTIEQSSNETPAQVPFVLHRRLRVLVADDEPLNRDIASNFLIRAGHEVMCVEDGATAVQAAAANDFDVVLMDVRMPGIDGLEATCRIRRLPGPRGAVRVVAVTAQAFTQQIDQCRQAGMDGHVAKPFKQAVLLAALQAVAGTAPCVPPAPAAPVKAADGIEPGEPVFNRDVFDEMASILTSQELEEHLSTLQRRCEALLARLFEPETATPGRTLADDAHQLVAGAGMFGFLPAAAAAREFEFALETGADDVAARSGELATALQASLTFIGQEIAAFGTAAVS